MDNIKKAIIKQYDFNLSYANKLVADIPETQMTLVPHKGMENHPAFTLGHLVSGSAMLTEDLGGTLELPDGWTELFTRRGPGDERLPEPDVTKYPSKNALLEALYGQHEKVKTLLADISDDNLNTPIKWRFHNYMPTLLDLVIFMCITHENMHLGQLACWRRALSYPSALAML